MVTPMCVVCASTTTHLGPWVRLDLRKLELGVVRVHLPDLFTRWRAKDLDDLHQLVHATVAGEYGGA